MPRWRDTPPGQGPSPPRQHRRWTAAREDGGRLQGVDEDDREHLGRGYEQPVPGEGAARAVAGRGGAGGGRGR